MPDMRMEVPETLRALPAQGPDALFAELAVEAASGAGAVGAGMLLSCVLLGWPWWCVPVGLVCGACIGAAVGGPLSVQQRHGERARILDLHEMWLAEVRTGLDIDGDGVIGEPGDPRIIPVYQWGGAKPDPDRAQFRAFVEGVWGATGSTWRKWEREGMTRKTWEEYCDRLKKTGVARPADARANAPLVLRATLEQAMVTLTDLT